jgi:arylsulfatase
MAVALVLAVVVPASAAADKPNIVLGGIIRGAPTPQLDKLAAEGLRLTNFNVEAQCTPSRSAIMSGRYAVHSGNGTIPLGQLPRSGDTR